MGFATDAHSVFIAYVVFVKLNLSAYDLFYSSYCLGLAVVQIIHHYDVVTRVYKFDGSVAADITGSARNENCTHILYLLKFLFQNYIYVRLFALVQYKTAFGFNVVG